MKIFNSLGETLRSACDVKLLFSSQCWIQSVSVRAKGHHPYLHTLRPHGLWMLWMTLTLPLWACTAIRLFAAQLLVQRSEVGSSKESTTSS